MPTLDEFWDSTREFFLEAMLKSKFGRQRLGSGRGEPVTLESYTDVRCGLPLMLEAFVFAGMAAFEVADREQMIREWEAAGAGPLIERFRQWQERNMSTDDINERLILAAVHVAKHEPDSRAMALFALMQRIRKQRTNYESHFKNAGDAYGAISLAFLGVQEACVYRRGTREEREDRLLSAALDLAANATRFAAEWLDDALRRQLEPPKGA